MKLREWDANLKLRLGGEFVTNVIFWTIFPFLSVYFASAFGKGTAGLLLVISQLISVFANLLGGYFTDRYGRKRVLVFAAMCQSVGYGLLAAGSSALISMPLIAFAGFTLASCSISLYHPASQAMVADIVPEKDRSSVFAVFYTSLNIAVVVGPLLGSIVYVGNPFYMPAVGAIACGLLATLLSRRLRETMPSFAADVRARTATGSETNAGSSEGNIGVAVEHGDAAADSIAAASAPTPTSWKRAIAAQLKGYRIIVSDRVFLLFIIAGVLLSQTFMQLDMLLPIYLKEVYPSSSLWVGMELQLTGQQTFALLLAENGLLVALFTVAVTRWTTQLKDRWIFIGGALCYAASMALFSQPVSLWSLAAIMAVFTLGELMCAGPQQTFISRLAPERIRGQYFAAASLRFTIGRTIAPLSIPLCGWIGFPWTFGVLALLAAASAVLYKIMFDWHERGGPSTQPLYSKVS
ncbi:MDR family MFS transporter [Paenibacillus herberti]|uniref:MFS transporter n=1 Tax=Paenibacillus herberti TaxID=1619309 RepID=A0A229NY55_9BACL|nr:MFS transporter [Paenibacillus herberti]OXM14832.1 MFS transporter [Paenibacillus herberti]